MLRIDSVLQLALQLASVIASYIASKFFCHMLRCKGQAVLIILFFRKIVPISLALFSMLILPISLKIRLA